MAPMIVVPKIVKQLQLADYAPEMAPGSIIVWLNPPRQLLTDYFDISAEVRQDPAANKATQLAGILAQLWSAGADPATHWKPEDVVQLSESTHGTDPQLVPWLVEKTFAMIAEHRLNVKKK